MRKRLTVLALLGGALFQAQTAGLPEPVRKAAERITAERLARDLAYLSSDELRAATPRRRASTRRPSTS